MLREKSFPYILAWTILSGCATSWNIESMGAIHTTRWLIQNVLSGDDQANTVLFVWSEESEVLKIAENIPNTFFLNAFSMNRDPSQLKRISDLKMQLARNLFFQWERVNTLTKEKMEAMLALTLEKKRTYSSLELFRDRTTLIMAHSELIWENEKNDPSIFLWNPLVWKKNEWVQLTNSMNIEYDAGEGKYFEKNRFWKLGLIHDILDQWWKVRLIRGEKWTDPKELSAALEKSLTNLPQGSTIILDWHGSPEAFYLTDGTIVKPDGQSFKEQSRTVKLSIDDLVKIFEKRYEALKNQKTDKEDILVTSACYGANFLRTFARKMIQKWLPLPILISSSEMGQYGYSNLSSPVGSVFLEHMVETRKHIPSHAYPYYHTIKGIRSTLGNILFRQYEFPFSNPSIYIPHGKSILQIG